MDYLKYFTLYSTHRLARKAGYLVTSIRCLILLLITATALMASSGESFHFGDFAKLDESGNAAYLMESMDVMDREVRGIKERAIAALQLQAGDFVLEVGCGQGRDAERLGACVGATGSVVAIDSSQLMIEAARSRSTQPNVKYMVHTLQDFHPERLFGAGYTHRLFIGDSDPNESMKTIGSFIKPGGKICVTDVDTQTIILSPNTYTTEIIMNEILASFVNPQSGRKLPQLLRTGNFKIDRVISGTSMIRDFTILGKIFPFEQLGQSAIKKGKLTQDQFEQWLADMRRAEADGVLLYCITLFTTIGTKMG